MTAGDGSLTVDSESVASVIYASPQITGIYNQTVNLIGTTAISRADYSGLVMQFGTDSSTPPQVIPVTVNATVNIASGVTASSGPAGGFGTIWVRKDYAGNIAIDNAGTVSLQAPDSSAAAISATTNLGAVTITNSGAVTSTGGRGIYADGNHNGTDPATISVTNTATGTVSATTAAIRVIAYNGLASIVNEGEARSTLFQGLIAWSANGDATITNTGTVTSNTDNAIYASTENGTATITNSGTVTATGDSSLDGDRAAIRAPAGYAGLIGSASDTGDIVITNEASGTVTASRDAAIRAETPQGNVTIINAGSLSGQTGIYVDSGQASGHTNATSAAVNGNISVTNSGTVTAQSIGVSLDGTANRLENSGTITVTQLHGTGVVTGNGDTTIINSGTIAAADAADTAISMGSGTNRLVLTETSSITGIVSASGASSTLELTGAGAGTFNAGQLSSTGQYRGFTDLAKSGTGNWTLTGSGGGVSGSLSVLDGTLQLQGSMTALTVTVEGSSTASFVTSGAGASWSSTGGVRVGMTPNTAGSLVISGGASAFIRNTGIYTGAGSQVLITGQNTRVEIGNPNDLSQAAWLSPEGGSVTVSDGAYLYASGIYAGPGGSNLVTMTITGAGTVVDAAERIYVGGQNGSRDVDPMNGNGNLTISGGAVVTTATLGVGMDPKSQGVLTVTGQGTQLWAKANSTYNALGNFYVGYNGNATVTVSDGAVIKADNEIRVGYDSQGSGKLIIGADAGSAAVAAGSVDTARIVFGTAGGSLVFNHTSQNYLMSQAISGNGSVNAAGGTTLLLGSNSYTGGTRIQGGTLRFTSDAALGAVSGAVTFAGGALSAADTTTVARSIVLESGSNTLDVASGKVLTVSGTISGTAGFTKSGTGTLALTGTNSYGGGTRIQGGTLSFTGDAALGSAAGAVVLAGGTLSAGETVSTGRSIALEGGQNTLEVTGGKVLTVSGTISGTTGFTKSGTGTLVLTGTNTYTGLTTIADGTLQLGNGGTSGSIVGDVVNNATLIFNRSDNYTFSGSITGNGAVLFQGGGKVDFASPYQGAVTVGNSTVTLEQGVQTTSVFTVENGGKLGGSGTIGGLVANSGAVVAPGYSPGTLVVTGTANFLGGSVYQVDATPSGRHDLIIASGAVTIDPAASVQVLGESGFYRPQTTYAIITSADAVNGAFGNVSSNFALLSPTLTYDAKNVYLTLNYNGLTLADFARTDNQRSAANALMALPVGDTLYDALAVLSGAEIAPALDQLSGEAYASAGTVIQQQSSYLRDAVGTRLRQGFTAHEALASAADAAGPRSSSMGGEHGVTIWAQGHGGWGRGFDGNNAATISSSLAGFLAGVDAGFGENARAGVVAGFSQSRFDVTSRNSSGDIDNYEVGVYGGARFGGVALKGGASYGLHDVSLDRSIAIRGFSGSAQSGYRQEAAQVFGEASYGFSAGQIALEPFAGLAFVHLAGASAQENGSPAALTVRLEDQNTFYTSLGMRAATQVNIMGRTFTPSVSLGWQHAFGDMAPVAAMRFANSTSPFEVKGVPLARNTALIGLGLSHSFTDRASVQVNYKSQISSEAVENSFSAQMSLKF